MSTETENRHGHMSDQSEKDKQQFQGILKDSTNEQLILHALIAIMNYLQCYQNPFYNELFNEMLHRLKTNDRPSE